MNKQEFWIDKLLQRFCSDSLYEGIYGDLQELYFHEVSTIGHTRAKYLYHWRAFGFFRSTFSKKIDQLKFNIAMWKNFFTITLRNLSKHKVYSIINILGLAIGLSAGFMILQYVYYETTYDQSFDNKENIYRVQLNRYNNGELSTQWAAGCAGAGLHMKEDFPEVEEFVNLHQSGAMVSRNKNYFQPEFAFYAGETFFKVFSIPLISGDRETALSEPYTVALSESMAEKLFGDEDPMGKNVKLNDEDNFMVTAVYQDFPEKSHMKFDLLYSFDTYVIYTSEDARTRWQWDGFLNYVALKDGTNPKVLEAKFPDWIEQREGEELATYNAGMEFLLQPLTEIHLTSHYRGEIKQTGDKTSTYFLLIIGMFVLVIAWINYINLTTARSINRAKEVGIRKVMGSFKSQLVHQFLFESSFINFLALSGAALLVIILFPYFNDFIGRPSSYSWPDASWFWFGLGTLFLAGIALSGLYPAVVLANFKPVTVLKGKFSGSAKGNLMRKGLVVFQFLASIILITGTYIVYDQLSFLQNQDLGFKTQQTLVIKTPSYGSDSLRLIREVAFKNYVNGESFVEGLSNSTSVPGRTPDWNAGGLRLITQTETEANQYRVIGMDENFIDFYGLKVIAGRGFDASYGNETFNILLNESAVKRVGFSNPEDVLNKDFLFWGDTFKIVGIVKDYRQESPKADYDALVFRYYESPNGLYSVNINSTNVRSSVDQIEQHWQSAFGDKPLDYFFLDDFYNEQYQGELKFGSIFSIFSGLAILVACLGLFGLASYMTSLRTKEVGVRKVLGASFPTLLLLLTGDFMKLVGIAILISVPLSWWIMDNWLQNFANRISLSPISFILPGLVLILIALATVSYHTYHTANLNPATTLKDE
ncbi:MAG: ABC transporter permease [Marinoscillum sp.]